MLNDPLDHILASPNKVRILRALTGLAMPVSGRQAARLAGASQRAQQALNELTDLGLVIRQDSTGQHLYSFNRENSLAPALVALFQAESARARELIGELKRLAASSADVLSGAVFGSNARRAARSDSDFDVLILVRAEKDIAQISEALLDAAPALFARFGIRISPIVLTKQRWDEQTEDPHSFAAAVGKEAHVFIGVPLPGAA